MSTVNAMSTTSPTSAPQAGSSTSPSASALSADAEAALDVYRAKDTSKGASRFL